jgi:hypothetical protein
MSQALYNSNESCCAWSYKISRLKSALFGQEWYMSSVFKLHVEDFQLSELRITTYEIIIYPLAAENWTTVFSTCSIIEERYFQMSPLISAMENKCEYSITLIKTCCFIPNRHCKWGLRNIPILPPLLQCRSHPIFHWYFRGVPLASSCGLWEGK